MRRVRVGNGCGFWGDSPDAPVRLAEHGRLDYLTLEYLAELTMSILAVQRQKDPTAGYATDFPDVLARLAPVLERQPGLKVVTNAGGMNPHGCAAKAKDVLRRSPERERRGRSARRTRRSRIGQHCPLPHLLRPRGLRARPSDPREPDSCGEVLMPRATGSTRWGA